MGSSLRVMSANLWSGKADPEALAGLLTSLEIDAVALQEVTPAQADAVASVLPHGQIETTEDDPGMGLALRRPASHARVPLAFRDAHVAHLAPDDWPQLRAPLELINVHIAAPHLPGPLGGMLHRRKQVHGLEQYLVNGVESQQPEARRAGECPDANPCAGHSRARVMVGDFNATPIWGVYRRIASHLTDAAIAVAQRRGRPLEQTWGPWHGAPRMLRIDHGFIQGVEVDEFRVVPLPGSDHSAIVMDVVSI